MVRDQHSELMSVLYSLKANVWKIADFGITAEFTSKSARTTKYARGSENYLPPELLAEHAVVTKKTDIWGLGCILFELVTGKASFNGYGSIREYAFSERSFKIPDLPYNKYSCVFIADTIHTLLAVDPTERPDAMNVRHALKDPTLLPTEFQSDGEFITRVDKKLVPVRFLGAGYNGNVFEVCLSNLQLMKF